MTETVPFERTATAAELADESDRVDRALTSPRSFAGDVLSVFGGDAKLWSSTIAARLAESVPSVYADITPVADSSQLRGLGVEVRNVREPGQVPNLGCERTAIEAVTP